MKIIICEFKKIIRSNLWLPLIIIPLFANIFGSINYSNNTQILTKEWYSLWTQVYLFYGMIFYPGIIGIICAYIWNEEHKSGLKHILLMPHKPIDYVISKNILGYILAIIVQVYFILCYIFIGKFVFKFSSPVPIELIALGCFSALLSIQMITIQNYLSLKIKAFAPPIGIAIVFAIGGFLVSAMNILGPLKYLYANGAISHTMNAYPDVSLHIGAMFIIVLFSLVSSIFFTYISNSRIEKLLN